MSYPLAELRNDMLAILNYAEKLRSANRDTEQYTSLHTDYIDKLSSAGLAIVKLMIAYKKSKESSKENDQRVISYSDLGTLFTELLNDRLEIGKTKRVQVIMQNFSHFNNLEIQITGTPTGNRMNVAILDAADSIVYQAVKESLFNAKEKFSFIDKIFWTSEAIQYDEITCFMFAIKLLSASSKEKNFHQFLSKIAAPSGEVRWSDFPAQFLKLCQSKSLLDKLLLKAYYQEYSSAFCECQDLDPIVEKFKNYGLSDETIESAYALSLDQINHYANQPPIPIDFFDNPLNRKGQNLMTYVSEHTMFRPGSDKPLNQASLDMFEHYAAILKRALNELTDEELNDILDEKKPFPMEKADTPPATPQL